MICNTKRIKQSLALVFSFVFSMSALAQIQYTIKGKVVDEDSKEWLISASVGIKEFPQRGMQTNESGDYKLDLAPGQYTLVFDLLGYEAKQVKINVTKNQVLEISLKPYAIELDQVVVSAERSDKNIKNVQMGVDKLTVETISKIPVLFGEKDILKTLQLLPGVQTAGEGNTGFYVRGGASDQNLILLDNATVYNPSHLFGFFSTFNSDAVEDMTLYKGSMPAQYGGRLSSALDVSMRDGNREKYKVSGGVGIISSRLTVEGPIQNNKSSFIVSGRRTYADALGRAAGIKAVKESSLYFYDLNAKLSYILSDRDKITVTGYNGKDQLGLKDLTNINWGNTVAGIKWNHRINEQSSSVTSATFSKYALHVKINFINEFKISSHITDYNLNHEYNFYPNDKNKFKIGVSSIYHNVIPGELSTTAPGVVYPKFSSHYSWENTLFASNNTKINDQWELTYGLRLSSFSVLGEGKYYTYDANQNQIDSITAKKNDFVKTYLNLEPRLGIAYQLNDISSVKAAYTRTTQNMHLLAMSNMESSPTDRWVSSTNYIKPEIANQVSFGYFRNFANNNYEFSAEVYYKGLENQIDYKDGATNVYQEPNIEPFLLFGKGRAYGLELFLKKKSGRFNGWIGYTLSKSQKKIEGINKGAWYTSNQDRTHDLSLVGIYDLNRTWSLSATWVYTTGAAITLPSAKYEAGDQSIYYYEGRNLYRSPAYHRLDIGATCILKKTKKYYSELAFSLYNAYGRHNAYIFGFRQSSADPSKSESYMIYLFNVIPSVSWNFKF